MFCVAKIDLKMRPGGIISLSNTVSALRTDLYEIGPDGNLTAEARTQFALEIIWVILVAWNILVEVYEVSVDVRQKGARAGISSYLAHPWNLIDWINIVIQLVIAVTWANYYNSYVCSDAAAAFASCAPSLPSLCFVLMPQTTCLHH